jgi:hypothetical protein
MNNEKIELAVEVLRHNILTTFGTRGLDALVFVRRNPQKATEWQKLTDQEIREEHQEPFWIDAVIAAEIERQCWCHCHVRAESEAVITAKGQCWCGCRE